LNLQSAALVTRKCSVTYRGGSIDDASPQN
jgi:hypothetical protein